jgi:hypothetical protein
MHLGDSLPGSENPRTEPFQLGGGAGFVGMEAFLLALRFFLALRLVVSGSGFVMATAAAGTEDEGGGNQERCK